MLKKKCKNYVMQDIFANVKDQLSGFSFLITFDTYCEKCIDYIAVPIRVVYIYLNVMSHCLHLLLIKRMVHFNHPVSTHGSLVCPSKILNIQQIESKIHFLTFKLEYFG